MTDSLPDLDFARIRPYGQPASRSNAFEEVATLLIKQGAVEWPDGVAFYRFGNPDGGREGKGELPNGDVWAWQAKYLFQFDSSATGQITSSVKRAINLEPNLKRYFIALPMDLPAGDTDKRKSAYTLWTEKVAEWEALAREKGMEVKFIFVGAHQLVTVLTLSRNSGHARYWFEAQLLTPEWQNRQLEDVIAKAGQRYTPHLHVDVNAAQALDGLGRVDAYIQQWQQVLAQLRGARQWAWKAPEQVAEVFSESLTACSTLLDETDTALESMIASARSFDTLPYIGDQLASATEAVLQVHSLLREHSLNQEGYFVGAAATLYSHIQDALAVLGRGEQLARATATQAASEKLLMLTGRAGVGKTHLFCDVASRRMDKGQPTLILLGQDFDSRSLVQQIPVLTQIGRSLDDVLSVLDAAAEAAGYTGLLMIDALNESERAERWKDDVRALIAAVARHPHVALALSCRMEFIDAVVGNKQMPTIEHTGFAESTDIAVRRYTREYGLEQPTFPVLNPEFDNPLFLKLTCEALATLGESRFQFGHAGLMAVYDAFIEAVNQRLSEPTRCDYDRGSNPVAKVISKLAAMGSNALKRAEVDLITQEILPYRTWSRSLMHGLIAEGVLIEISHDRLAFGYQRLGDITRASAIADQSLDGVKAWLTDDTQHTWQEQGVLGALALVVPERYGTEVIDLVVGDDGKIEYDYIDAFLESIMLRSPTSISPRTVEIVQGLLRNRDLVGDIWNQLIRISCVPNHPLNAGWLHNHLATYDVADRDNLWSTWLIGVFGVEDESAARRLIDWAWPANLDDLPLMPDDVAVLATKTLGWFLTTSDRQVRDRATKALVCIAGRAPAGFAQAVGSFKNTNDPYVVERLAAAACGALLRTHDATAAQQVADGVLELVSEKQPEHLMTRDYVRRVCDVAGARGWSVPNPFSSSGEQWPISSRSREEIEALAGPPDYEYGSIWYSLTGMGGDFGRYVVQSTLRDIVSDDPKALQDNAERAVFDRVLELGWTPAKFREIDRGRSGGHDGTVERIGKKYQWIGFHEVLGRIVDHHAIKPPWGGQESEQYKYAEQLVWRDIDPTILVRKPAVTPISEPRWFSSSSAHFPDGLINEYPSDMQGVPDPLDLITVSDSEGEDWLVLVSNPSWKQSVPPEIKALKPSLLDVWMQVHAYLVPVEQAKTLQEWAKNKDWFGKWMPEVPESHNVLLGAHPHDPTWSAADGNIEWWEQQTGGPQPADLMQCAVWYGGTGTSRDASSDEETRGYLPSRQLYEMLRLSAGVDFTWRDASGTAVQDPSVVMGGPGTLVVRRDLVPQLIEEGFTLFWTVLAGKELHNSDHVIPRDDYRWVSASASYILNDKGIEQIDAIASRCSSGPTIEHQLEWSTKAAEQ